MGRKEKEEKRNWIEIRWKDGTKKELREKEEKKRPIKKGRKGVGRERLKKTRKKVREA